MFELSLSPIKIGSLELKNRFMVPPMGTNYASIDGEMTERVIDYYTARAKGGFGLIVQEVTAVAPAGRAIPFQIGVWDDSFIPGLTKLTTSIHQTDCKIIMQLHHAGRQTAPVVIGGLTPVAPSAIACPSTGAMPHELTIPEIEELVEQYGDGALRAKKSGYDGVEIHAAHGYLIAQFLSPHSNKRMDKYGGTFQGRLRFAQEIIRNVRKKVGKDYPVMLRISSDEFVHGGLTPQLTSAIVAELEKEGIDAFSITVCNYRSMFMMTVSSDVSPGFNQEVTGRIKQSVSVPVAVVGRINSPYIAEDILRAGKADLIALGRESLSDPEFPNKVKEGRLEDISPCIACAQSCIGYLLDASGKGDMRVSCLVNPLCGKEHLLPLKKTAQPKKITIVGAGPAGMYAAWIAAQIGHDVTVYEKEDKLGGQFRIAGIPPAKHEVMAALQYYKHQGDKFGVNYKMSTEATADLIAKETPDVVILSTGGIPARPPISGIDNPKIKNAIDVLDGKESTENKVLILGGGMTGAETAAFLGEHARQVSIVEMRPHIAYDVEDAVRHHLIRELAEYGTSIYTDAKVTRIYDDGIEYQTVSGEIIELRGFTDVVLAMGVKAHNPLEEQVKAICANTIVIGDAAKPGRANKAIEEGLAAVLSL